MCAFCYLVDSGAFSVGMPFNYWHKYSSTEDEIDKIKKENEYYVEKKYDNFENEIREYDSNNFSHTLYKKETLKKAEQYMKTKLIKSIPYLSKFDHYDVKYNIPRETRISLNGGERQTRKKFRFEKKQIK